MTKLLIFKKFKKGYKLIGEIESKYLINPLVLLPDKSNHKIVIADESKDIKKNVHKEK